MREVVEAAKRYKAAGWSGRGDSIIEARANLFDELVKLEAAEKSP